MILLVALAIFAGLSAATWLVSVACFRSTFPASPDVTALPNYRAVSAGAVSAGAVSAGAVAAVTLTCFVPFPAGYLAGLVAWAVAVYGFLALPAGRATALFGYLAAWSVVSRLAVLGVLAAFPAK